MEYVLLPGQFDTLTSTKKFSFMIGGIGGGKTFTLSHFVLKMIREFPGTKGLIVANTYKQLIDTTIPMVTNLLDDLGIKYKYTQGRKIKISKTKTTILIYSLEQYDNIRGMEVGWIAADELAKSCMEAFNVIIGRLRCKYGPLFFRAFTSPMGFNFLYEIINNPELINLGLEVITIKTKDNYNVGKEYYETLLASYGGENSPLARQELFGEFVNLTSGSVYFSFNRLVHCKEIKDDGKSIVYVGCDFNAGNMNYVAVTYDGKMFRVLEAKTLDGYTANTFSMAQDIWEKYGPRARIIADSTGNSRKTSAQAGLTDLKILENAGLTILPFLNPPIKDRQNTLNIHYLKNIIELNESKCKNLIIENEKLSANDNEGKVAHLSVALGYVVYKLNPILTRQSKSTTITSPFTRGK